MRNFQQQNKKTQGVKKLNFELQKLYRNSAKTNKFFEKITNMEYSDNYNYKLLL